jgi:ferric-dicitrate binding protein FerR (iron transport regulator)
MERLEALESERDRERAAVRELEAKLRELAANRAITNERGRYRRAVGLAFILGLVGLIGALYLLLVGSSC